MAGRPTGPSGKGQASRWPSPPLPTVWDHSRTCVCRVMRCCVFDAPQFEEQVGRSALEHRPALAVAARFLGLLRHRGRHSASLGRQVRHAVRLEQVSERQPQRNLAETSLQQGQSMVLRLVLQTCCLCHLTFAQKHIGVCIRGTTGCPGSRRNLVRGSVGVSVCATECWLNIQVFQGRSLNSGSPAGLAEMKGPVKRRKGTKGQVRTLERWDW